jgi:polar amino acid transport system permease protein
MVSTIEREAIWKNLKEKSSSSVNVFFIEVIADKICWFYIYFFRGTPLMMQIFFVYFALPRIPIPVPFHGYFYININDPFLAACIALSLNSAAYCAEIIRAAIQSIDKGQFEAAKALGMSYTMTMKQIIIPQSIRRLIPPVGNEFIALLKDTALVSAIGMADLMKVTRDFQNQAGEFKVSKKSTD